MLEFCPKCQNLMRHQSTQGLKMQCHVCLHLEPIRTLTIYTDDYRPVVTDQYPVHAELCEDKTLARTLKMTCPNGACPSNKPNNKLKPEVILFHYNSDYTQGYICSVCKSYWKQGLKQSTTELENPIKTENDLAEELKSETKLSETPIKLPNTVTATISATQGTTSATQTATQTATQIDESIPQTATQIDESIPQTATQTATQVSESMPTKSAMATGVMTELGQEAMQAKKDLKAPERSSEASERGTEASKNQASTEDATEGVEDATKDNEITKVPTEPTKVATAEPVAVTFRKKGEPAPPASIPIKSPSVLEITSQAAKRDQPVITSRKLPAPTH